jgi:hypothetical protein
MNDHADSGPASRRSWPPQRLIIPTESLLRLRRTLRRAQDIIDLDDAKLLLELVDEELCLRTSEEDIAGLE